MKKIRRYIFETNSSSSHSLAFSKKNRGYSYELLVDEDGVLTIPFGEFGWGPDVLKTPIDKLSYEENLRKLKDFHCKVLVLGYKTFRRGELLYQKDSERIEKNKAMLNNLLPTIIKENWFEVISFDNLALEQLDVKDLMTEDQWEEFYLGDDGIGDEYNSASMYVDMVERKFAKNSCSVERFDLLDTVEDMYQFLKNRKMEK